MQLDEVYRYIRSNSQSFIDDLVQLVNQPSVSARKEGMQECAQIVDEMMRDIGLSTRIIPEEEGNPVVYGEIESESSDKTLLFYDHYDVQPPEPIEEWICQPFSAEIRDGKIYGRGAADNKGNIVSRLKAVDAFMETQGSLPVNIKFLIEGEEEIGSPHLAPVIQANKELFSADAAIWEFGGTDRHGRPCVYLGLKGVLSVELRAQGAERDVHSANAPLIPNPAWRLVWALNTLKNAQDKILIDGFYDRVESPSDEELSYLKEIPFEEDEEKRELGLEEFLHGLSGIDAVKTLLYKPTCTINGFLTGYTEAGSKTVLPNKAIVKLDFRLVPGQMPDEIFDRLVKHLKAEGFDDIDVIQHGSTEPTKTPISDKFVQQVIETAEKVYKKQPVVYPTSAGSGPMHLLRNWLGHPVVSVGCAHAESRGHAPNENITIDGFITGTKFIATIINDFNTS
ncbi:M20/M25/M40 family metallo-hydrolase [Candidatus Bathyarchaeota archaeon]|nr:M20/M25/M40 family metallo-hydrolase [Candidatus Bathyarchaeota archaeon]NIR14142.1 M20/M25/M40 family metallo-hydrolase [Desulfobacterales bacterium]NIU80815.1 M20/M25/M40 family metallo-hydrolase [Candidatus Bathyarchaeota archaeon]NIV67445.1 M20/M25/M40 family metallo-hydrolase [Candidatus Bathyarchaeota archaeon]NIW15982.1 M20/M25/M40 family metallo-hydrolase [Candidatus Bathyarchaeota archaeon]